MHATLHPAPPWRSLYAFESNWFALGGNERLHYIDEGPRLDAGPQAAAHTLLFVHGNPTWSFHWRRIVTAMRDQARCVAIDHLGCGLSDKPQRAVRLAERAEHLGRLVDELALERVTLVAQDWGGAIGLGAMLARRERLAGIVLFNTGAFPPWFVPRRIGVLHTPILGRVALQGLNVFSRAALSQTLARQRGLPREVAAGYLAPYDTWGNRRAVYEFVADIPRTPAHPTWQTLKEIEAGLPSLAALPIRLVWGMRDWCFTPECLDRFLTHWPAARVDRLADVGHWVVEDAPEEALVAVQEALAVAR
ncbi:MAG: alpha/beta fold hydrolase [Lacipirellulaceae bacterium]